MKKIVALLVALSMSVPAFAQSTDAAADATNTVNVVAITGAQGSSHQKSSGHLYTTPTVLGSSFGGANPCLVGQGVGAAGGPFGFNLSIGKSDKGCHRRSNAAALKGLGHPGAAMAHMCQDKEVAQAFFDTYKLACPGTDRRLYKFSDGTLPEYADLSGAQ